MVALYFRMEEVPRTVGREEWYGIWRKVRIQRKELKAQDDRLIELLRDKSKSIPDHIRREMMDRMIYPPVLLGPYMDHSYHERPL